MAKVTKRFLFGKSGKKKHGKNSKNALESTAPKESTTHISDSRTTLASKTGTVGSKIQRLSVAQPSKVISITASQRAEPAPEIEKKPEDFGKALVNNLKYFEIVLLIFMRWPLSHEKDGWNHRKYVWYWGSIRSICFIFMSLVTVVFFFAAIWNIMAIMLIQKDRPCDRTEMEILEQALLERNTVFLLMMMLSLFCHSLTSVLLLTRHDELQQLFTRTVQFSMRAKINLTKDSYWEVVPLVLVFIGTNGIIAALYFFEPTATTYGGPTVMTIILFRPFLPDGYLTTAKYPGSQTHWVMHLIGTCLILVISVTTYLYIFLLFWLLRVQRNGWVAWNQRAFACCCRGEKLATVKNRTTYTCMFKDHVDLQRMAKLLNEVYDLILEAFLLKLTFLICYEAHLVIKSATDGSGQISILNVGQYFVRPKDYIPAAVLFSNNMLLISMIMWAACWFEDDAMNGYEIIRRKAYLDGLKTDTQVYFCMTLLQAYTGPTKLKLEAGDYVNIDRSNILVLFSLLFTSTLVVYQLAPAYDFNTEFFNESRYIIGNFLAEFEKLPKDHFMIKERAAGHRYN